MPGTVESLWDLPQPMWLRVIVISYASDPSVITLWASNCTRPQHPWRAWSRVEEESLFWPSPISCQGHPSCSRMRLLFLPAQHQCLLVGPEPKCFKKSLPSVSEIYWGENGSLERGCGMVVAMTGIFHIGVWFAVFNTQTPVPVNPCENSSHERKAKFCLHSSWTHHTRSYIGKSCTVFSTLHVFSSIIRCLKRVLSQIRKSACHGNFCRRWKDSNKS